jgi:hypothetical protein
VAVALLEVAVIYLSLLAHRNVADLNTPSMRFCAAAEAAAPAAPSGAGEVDIFSGRW